MALKMLQIRDPKTGDILGSVEIDTRMSPEERKLAVTGRIAELRGMTHTRSSGTDPARMSLPPDMLSDEPLSAMQSFQAGRTRGSGPKEVAAALGGQTMKGPGGNLYNRQSPDDKWTRVNPSGADWGDVPRFLGDQIGQGAGELVGALAGKTPLGMIAKGTVGAIAGSLANEGVQSLEGTQREELNEVLGRAVVEDGGLALAGGVAGGLLSKFGAGPKQASSQRMGEVLDDAAGFAANNQGYPQLLPGDILPHTGMGLAPGGAVNNMVNQAMRANDRYGGAVTDRAVQAQNRVMSDFQIPPQARATVNQELERVANAQRDAIWDATSGMGSQRGGEKALNEAADIVRKAEQNKVSQFYEGPMAEVVRDEKPVFDVDPLRKRWEAPKLDKTEMRDTGLLDENGAPIEEEMIRQIEVIPEATGKIAKLKSILSTLDRDQTNFEALKRIRTVAGRLSGEAGFRDLSMNPAARLYGDITEVMENPKGLPADSKYLETFRKANALNVAKHQLLDDPTVAKALAGPNGGKLVREFVNNPQDLFNENFETLLDKAPAPQRSKFRNSVHQAVLDTKDPMQWVEANKKASNYEPYRYLFDSTKQMRDFENAALEVSSFWKSPLAKVYDNQIAQQDAAKVTLKEASTPERTGMLWAGLDQPAQEAFRSAAVDDLVTASMEHVSKTGAQQINPVALEKGIEGMKKSGVWDKLTPEQRRTLPRLANYYRVVINKLASLGDGLENASMAADLKGMFAPITPGTISGIQRAAQTMSHNQFLSSYMQNPKRANRLLKRLKKTPASKRRMIMSMMLSAPLAAQLVSEQADQPNQ